MSDIQSAFPHAQFEGAVSVKELGPTGMITIRGDFGDKAFAKALKSVTALELPAQRARVANDKNAALWMSPDELLVITSYEESEALTLALQKAFEGLHALVVDVSDARAFFALRGEGARELLAKLAPVDMAPDQFSDNQVRRTRLAQVAAAFWMTEEGCFELVTFRSVAEYAFTLLANSAGSKPFPEYF